MRDKVEQFGDDYFYQLGLNLKFCEGIYRFQKLEMAAKFGMGIKSIIYNWSDQKCSQAGYSELVSNLEELDGTENGGDLMREYFEIWAGR